MRSDDKNLEVPLQKNAVVGIQGRDTGAVLVHAADDAQEHSFVHGVDVAEKAPLSYIHEASKVIEQMTFAEYGGIAEHQGEASVTNGGSYLAQDARGSAIHDGGRNSAVTDQGHYLVEENGNSAPQNGGNCLAPDKENFRVQSTGNGLGQAEGHSAVEDERNSSVPVGGNCSMVQDEGKILDQDEMIPIQNDIGKGNEHPVEEEELYGFPLWVKWRGKWQAGIKCAMSDCPSATLKAMPTYDRKTYIVIFFPSSRSHFWTDAQLACAISEKPEPLASGTHESGRELVKDPSIPRRYMLQKLAVSMLDASDKLHVEAVVESARNVNSWKEFAKEAAKCTSYSDLGRMLLKLHTMILDIFISPSWKKTFNLWKEQCENTRTASQTEKLTNELMDAILWEDVGKLWDVPLQLGEEWKTWKKEVMKLFSTAHPWLASEKAFDKDSKEEYRTSVDPPESNSFESGRKRQKLEIRRGHASEGKNVEDHVSAFDGGISSAPVANSNEQKLTQDLSVQPTSETNECPRKDSTGKLRPYRHCSAFLEKKRRTCNRWAMDGDTFCCKHSALFCKDSSSKLDKFASSSEKVDIEKDAPICLGLTVHGKRCSHKARNGSLYCLKHMINEAQNSEADGKPSSTSAGAGQKRPRLYYEGQASGSLPLNPKKEDTSATWFRCIGTLRNHGGQCSHRAKPGSSYCEKHSPISIGFHHIYNPSLLNGIFKTKSEEEWNPKNLLNEYLNMRLTEGSNTSINTGGINVDWILERVKNLKFAEDLLKEVNAEMDQLADTHNFQKAQVDAVGELHDNLLLAVGSIAFTKNQYKDDGKNIVNGRQESSIHFVSLECKACAQKFSDAEAFGNHLVVYHKKQVEKHFRGHACRYCVSAFTNKKGLERHVKIHHKEFSYEQCSQCYCVYCNRRFDGFDELSQHVVCVHCKELCKCIAENEHLGVAEHPTRMGVQPALPSATKQDIGLDSENMRTKETNGINAVAVDDDSDIGEKRTFVREGAKKFTCRFCGMKFSLLPDLGRHHQAKHKGSTVPANKANSSKRKETLPSKGRVNNSINRIHAALAVKKKKYKRTDFRRSIRMKSKSQQLEGINVLTSFSESHCAAIADMLLSEGKKIKPWPNNLEILDAARLACCIYNFHSALEKKYGKLPERLYIKAVKICSEENIIVEWHREDYLCPKGCHTSIHDKATTLPPLPVITFNSVDEKMTSSQPLIERNGLMEAWEKTESHLVLHSSAIDKFYQRKTIVLLEDLSFGQEPVPIPCVVDDDSVGEAIESLNPWESFQYVTKRLLDPSLGLDTKSSQLACTCIGRKCNPDSCDHVYLFDNDNENAEDIYGKPMQGRFPYDANGRIILEKGLLVYECNSMCACDLDCQNRVLQRGVRVKMEVFKTQHKGWAVRAAEPIARGTFICEYNGEVLNDEEASRRGKRYDKDGCSYLYDIDPHINVNDLMEECKPYVIDATKFGNVARFINHSCSPNLVNYQVLVESMDCQLAHIGLYASRDIAVGEELAYDYHYRLLPGSGIHCLCGSLKCRGRLC